MNFLAHFFLSDRDEDLMVGNFLGDYLKNRQVLLLPEEIQTGVRLHRAIDRFTDQHPAVRQSARMLKYPHRRYAPVILDVLFDHLLANHWGRYMPGTELQHYANGVYDVLLRHQHLMPEGLHERVPRMVAANWLVQYGTEEGLRYTFDRLRLRSSRPEWFDGALTSYQRHLVALTWDFHRFFPDAIGFVKDWRSHNQQAKPSDGKGAKCPG